MDNQFTAIALYKLSEQNRILASDELVKANAPNAKDLCTGQLDFNSAFNEIASQSAGHDLKKPELNSIISSHIQQKPVTKSVREATVDLSSAYIQNMSMLKLINHFHKQDRAVIDGFKPQ